MVGNNVFGLKDDEGNTYNPLLHMLDRTIHEKVLGLSYMGPEKLPRYSTDPFAFNSLMAFIRNNNPPLRTWGLKDLSKEDQFGKWEWILAVADDGYEINRSGYSAVGFSPLVAGCCAVLKSRGIAYQPFQNII